MKDRIEEVFSSVTIQYGGCVFCALDRQVTLHETQLPQQLLTDHGLNPALFGALDEQPSIPIEGRCYGCGMNLRLLNAVDEYITGQGCIYSNMTCSSSYLVRCLWANGTSRAILEVGTALLVTISPSFPNSTSQARSFCEGCGV
ncbi:hypothetical protein V1527DRAFT_45068 [Lipomyces starkeyi]